MNMEQIRQEELHKHALGVADAARMHPRQERFALLGRIARSELGIMADDIADVKQPERTELLFVISTARDLLVENPAQEQPWQR